ncbi:MAG: WG repeat-containing protein [Ruminococcus sp.]|nr:WG repeat-containing protein [Ruminococcus sp.]
METVQSETTTQTTAVSASSLDKLIKYEDGDDYGYKDIDGNIVVPAQYPNSSYFNNPDMTGEAVKV